MAAQPTTHCQYFQQFYAELINLLKLYNFEQITSNIILYRALERILGALTITAKRIQKAHPQWQIPHYKVILRLKNKIVWNFQPLRKNYLKFLIVEVFPEIHNYIVQKTQNHNENET